MADKEQHLEDGRRAIPLEPSSGVDPRVHLPDDQREVATRTLANGTVVKDYRDPPPTADEYQASFPPEEEYEAMIEEVIAEVEAEEEAEARAAWQSAADEAIAKRESPPDPLKPPQSTWDPAPLNRLGLWAKTREAKKAPDGNPWERLDDSA